MFLLSVIIEAVHECQFVHNIDVQEFIFKKLLLATVVRVATLDIMRESNRLITRAVTLKYSGENSDLVQS